MLPHLWGWCIFGRGQFQNKGIRTRFCNLWQPPPSGTKSVLHDNDGPHAGPPGAGSPGTTSRLVLQWSWPYKSGTIEQHQRSNLETQNLVAFVLHLQMLFRCSPLDNSYNTCTQDHPPTGSDLVLTDSASSGYKREDGQLSNWMWVSAAMENLQRKKLDSIKGHFFHYLETCRQGTNISLFCSFLCFVLIQVQNSV